MLSRVSLLVFLTLREVTSSNTGGGNPGIGNHWVSSTLGPMCTADFDCEVEASKSPYDDDNVKCCSDGYCYESCDEEASLVAGLVSLGLCCCCCIGVVVAIVVGIQVLGRSKRSGAVIRQNNNQQARGAPMTSPANPQYPQQSYPQQQPYQGSYPQQQGSYPQQQGYYPQQQQQYYPQPYTQPSPNTGNDLPYPQTTNLPYPTESPPPYQSATVGNDDSTAPSVPAPSYEDAAGGDTKNDD